MFSFDIAGLAHQVLQLSGTAAPVVLIDGGSGAGKTVLAQQLWQALVGLTNQPIQRVSLDDCYPGWQGLRAGSQMVHREILRAAQPGYRRWDWHRYAPAEWVHLSPELPIIVEGCGALTRQSLPRCTAAIWCECDPATRHARIKARDGDDWWWVGWTAQEEQHWRTHSPWQLAHRLVATSSSAPA